MLDNLTDDKMNLFTFLNGFFLIREREKNAGEKRKKYHRVGARKTVKWQSLLS